MVTLEPKVTHRVSQRGRRSSVLPIPERTIIGLHAVRQEIRDCICITFIGDMSLYTTDYVSKQGAQSQS